MARDWTCPRCAAVNSEAMVGCPSCGLLRGAAVETPAIPQAEIAAALGRPSALEGSEASSAPVPLAEPVAPAEAPRGRRIPLRLILIVAVLGASTIGGWYFSAGRSTSGEISKAGDLAANELRVGDCFDLKDPAADQIQDVTGRPCTQEHEYETFHVGTVVSDTYPDEDTFGAWVADNCGPAFATYVGKPYEDSELDVFWFFPESAGWQDGDRSVQCALYHPRIHRLTESLKGSAR